MCRLAGPQMPATPCVNHCGGSGKPLSPPPHGSHSENPAHPILSERQSHQCRPLGTLPRGQPTGLHSLVSPSHLRQECTGAVSFQLWASCLPFLTGLAQDAPTLSIFQSPLPVAAPSPKPQLVSSRSYCTECMAKAHRAECCARRCSMRSSHTGPLHAVLAGCESCCDASPLHECGLH